MTVYHENEYEVVNLNTLLNRHKKSEFQWRREHGIRIPNPREDEPHIIPNIERVGPETVAFAAIGGNWQALEVVNRLALVAREPEYICTKCGETKAASEFYYDGRTSGRGYTRSWCIACEKQDRHARYLRQAEKKRKTGKKQGKRKQTRRHYAAKPP